MKWKIQFYLSVLCLCLGYGEIWGQTAPQNLAVEVEGSCEFYSFKKSKKGKIRDQLVTHVMTHNAPVYECATGNCPMKKIDFNTMLRFTKMKLTGNQERVEVRRKGKKTPIGWMNRKDLLCSKGPLKNEFKIDRKLFIKPKPVPKGELQKVVAYDSSHEESCLGRCQELTRFQLYYVVAEDKKNSRFLLKVDPRSKQPLVGWVNYHEGLSWNTALGIRPADGVPKALMYPPIFRLSYSQIEEMKAKAGPDYTQNPIWETLERLVQ